MPPLHLIPSVVLLVSLLSIHLWHPVSSDAENGCADVVNATATQQSTGDGGTWTFSVTVSSPYETGDGWDKYADAWEVRDTAATATATVVLGTRVLLHPHVAEQPFTRSLSGVAVPEAVESVTIAARDSVAGFCGRELVLELERNNNNTNEGPTTTTAVPGVTPAPETLVNAGTAPPSKSPSLAGNAQSESPSSLTSTSSPRFLLLQVVLANAILVFLPFFPLSFLTRSILTW